MKTIMRKSVRYLLLYTGAFVALIWALAPIYWIIVSSISTRTELLSKPYKHWIPTHPTLQNFIDVFTTGQKYRAGGTLPTSELLISGLRNSMVISVSVAVLVTIVALLAGYVFARMKFRLKDPVFFYIMLLMPLPIWVSLVSLYFMMTRLGLTDSNLGLILILGTMALPLAVLLMATFIRDLPYEIEEAAFIDGASRWQTLWLVIFPLVLPGASSAFLVSFLNTWNAYMIPMIFSNTEKSQTITVVLSLFIGQYEVAWEQMAAATVFVMIPPILLALFFQRYLVRGLSMGAVKG
jgi:multiple sugar transport system permease protein